MTVDDDRLSEREHADLRDLVLAGAQRADAMRPRRALVAASIALVLVGGLIGGSVVAVTRLTEHPFERIAGETSGLPFGGDCADAVTAGELAAVDDRVPLVPEVAPRAGGDDVLGGIWCSWSREGGEGPPTRVWIGAYPERVASADAGSTTREPVCVELQGDPSMASCSTMGAVGGMRLTVGVSGDPARVTEDAVDALSSRVAERLVATPGDGPLAHGADWWPLPECSALAGAIIEGRAGDVPPITPAPDELALPGGLTSELQRDAGAARACALELSGPEYVSDTPNGVGVEVVPGGAVAFDSVRTNPGAEAVDVPGASEAFLVDRDPAASAGALRAQALIVTDGVNVLALTPSDPGPGLPELIALAASLLRWL